MIPDDQSSVLNRQRVFFLQFFAEHHILQTDKRLDDSAVLDDIFQILLSPVDRNGKAYILSAENYGSIDSDYFAIEVYERTARISLINRNISLENSSEMLHLSACSQ